MSHHLLLGVVLLSAYCFLEFDAAIGLSPDVQDGSAGSGSGSRLPRETEASIRGAVKGLLSLDPENPDTNTSALVLKDKESKEFFRAQLDKVMMDILSILEGGNPEALSDPNVVNVVDTLGVMKNRNKQ